MRPLAIIKGLSLNLSGLEEPVAVYTDPLKLRQILVNIIANAVKFTEHGDVLVLLRMEGLDTESKIRLEVSDTGEGIALEDREHVFDPFWQKDPSARNTAGSSGLGLSVARRLSRLLGGDVVVSASVPEQGSTLVITLPAHFEQPKGERRAADRRASSSKPGREH